ncbi:hypothetical protein [Streptomyces sp. NPDC001502]|uniref:hypothetical protein n=1 Tax=Streptomyces sp. NPDC001502 TaxID=3364578 RepID=UPI0036C570F3
MGSSIPASSVRTRSTMALPSKPGVLPARPYRDERDGSLLPGPIGPCPQQLGNLTEGAAATDYVYDAEANS